MTPSLWLVGVLSCAQFGPAAEASQPPLKAATSKVVAVTVYQGQALVTREVNVPEGDGTVEVVVTPMPAQADERSLYAEGAEGLRVLSTRFRTRAASGDSKKEVRAGEERIKTLQAEGQRLQKESEVQKSDLQYLQKLEGFTGTAMTGLTAKARLDSKPILELSKFVMETRAARTKAESDLRDRIQSNTEEVERARQSLIGAQAGTGRIERDAVIVVQKSKRAAGTVRLGYLVSAATWSPQYRLRGGVEKEPVRLEYLAAVSQATGEDWPNVLVTLSTARPSLDAAPPDLLPLKMAVNGGEPNRNPVESTDQRSRPILAELEKTLTMTFPNETPLEDVLKYIKINSTSATLPNGIPIYVDPVGLQEEEKSLTSPVTLDVENVPLRTSLRVILKQLGLTYEVKDGLLTITSASAEDNNPPQRFGRMAGGMGGMGGGMAGMGGGLVLEKAKAAGGAILNREAANEQAEELRVTDNKPGTSPAPAERDIPVVTFAVSGRLDIPSRRDAQLIEVARIELPAKYYAKAVPVLTPRVYRLATLTNGSEHVLLPGEATVYVGSDFVGRMRLPLVAAGEPFVAGFGVDPQVQVSRRLVAKSRTVQGGNQILTYEFRIALRNYRAAAMSVQLWDRLPRPQGETVGVNLVKTSVPLSTDPLYLRTGRLDNLLRWDVDVPSGTVGDKTVDITYEFRLEYARDLPAPRFDSGDFEKPIGGGAMGGMGGMSGGFRSTRPEGLK